VRGSLRKFLCKWIDRYPLTRITSVDVIRPLPASGARLKNYRRVSRQPAASASSTEQNQRVPFEIFISIFAYQRLVGW